MCEWGTYEKIVLPGKVVRVDSCIASIVSALNDGGCATIASCCGHGRRPGNIVLSDGKELIICPDYKTGRLVDKAFPAISEAVQ